MNTSVGFDQKLLLYNYEYLFRFWSEGGEIERKLAISMYLFFWIRALEATTASMNIILGSSTRMQQNVYVCIYKYHIIPVPGTLRTATSSMLR